MPSLIKPPGFEDLVGRHLRTVTDNVTLSQQDMETLQSDPILWWVELVQRKKAVETQLAARKAELRVVKRRADLGQISPEEEMQADLDFAAWRAKSLRFKNVVEQVIAEVAVLVERHRDGFFREVIVEERNEYAQRLRTLEDGVRALREKIESVESDSDYTLELAYLFDLVEDE